MTFLHLDILLSISMIYIHILVYLSIFLPQAPIGIPSNEIKAWRGFPHDSQNQRKMTVDLHLVMLIPLSDSSVVAIEYNTWYYRTLSLVAVMHDSLQSRIALLEQVWFLMTEGFSFMFLLTRTDQRTILIVFWLPIHETELKPRELLPWSITIE